MRGTRFKRFRLSGDVGFKRAVTVLLGLHILSLAAIGVAPYVPSIIVVPVIVISLTFVPGSLLLMVVSDKKTLDVEWNLYAVGLSLCSLMGVGLVVNLVLPHFGVPDPLSVGPLTAAITAYVFLLSLVVLVTGRQRELRLSVVSFYQPAPLFFLLVPLVSVLSVLVLNATEINIPLVIVIIIIAAIPLLGLRWVSRKYYPLVVWTTALAVLYHKSLAKYTGFAGSPGVVRTWEAARWTPGIEGLQPTSTELLQNGILFPTYAKLTHLDILTELNVVSPFFVAFIPLGLFVAFRRYTDSNTAFLGALLFVFAHPFYLQYPTAGRAATPVLFLALFGVVISNRETASPQKAILCMIFLIGVSVTHYGTAYFVAAAFVGAIAFMYFLRSAREFVSKKPLLSPAVRYQYAGLPDKRQALFLGLGGFFLASTITWYMYLTGGRKFEILPRHSVNIISQMLEGTLFAGRTVARLNRDYGSPSVAYSKYLYGIVGVLMVIGLAVTYYQYLSQKRETVFDAQYLSLATTLLGIFMITFLFRTWGGGRPMMITFVFTAVFAVLGTRWLSSTLANISLVGLRSPLSNVSLVSLPDLQQAGPGLFAVLLAVLLVLNTGVASTTVLGGDAPSNVPNQAQFDESESPGLRAKTFHQTDVQTHVWLVTHHAPGVRMYGDRIAQGQTDWVLPQIEAQTPGLNSYGRIRPRDRVGELTKPGVEGGYVILLGHNLALGSFSHGWTRENIPLGILDEELAKRHRVYTTGDSVIYYAPG